MCVLEITVRNTTKLPTHINSKIIIIFIIEIKDIQCMHTIQVVKVRRNWKGGKADNTALILPLAKKTIQTSNQNRDKSIVYFIWYLFTTV